MLVLSAPERLGIVNFVLMAVLVVGEIASVVAYGSRHVLGRTVATPALHLATLALTTLRLASALALAPALVTGLGQCSH